LLAGRAAAARGGGGGSSTARRPDAEDDEGTLLGAVAEALCAAGWPASPGGARVGGRRCAGEGAAGRRAERGTPFRTGGASAVFGRKPKKPAGTRSGTTARTRVGAAGLGRFGGCRFGAAPAVRLRIGAPCSGAKSSSSRTSRPLMEVDDGGRRARSGAQHLLRAQNQPRRQRTRADAGSADGIRPACPRRNHAAGLETETAGRIGGFVCVSMPAPSLHCGLLPLRHTAVRSRAVLQGRRRARVLCVCRDAQARRRQASDARTGAKGRR
jgi:hypothetical protein